MNKLIYAPALVIFLLLNLFSSQSKAQTCGNGATGGPTSPPPHTGNGTNPKAPDSNDPVNAYTGDEYREVEDLRVWGAVTEGGFSWSRYAHSRTTSGQQLFGTGHNWRHSYQWDVADGGINTLGQARITINYPEGDANTFTQLTPTQWSPSLSVPDSLTQTGNDFYLQRQNGWTYHIVHTVPAKGTSYYLVTDFTDNLGNVTVLIYDSANRLIQVKEPAGRSFTIKYQQISIRANYFGTYATIAGVPPANQWTQIDVPTNTTACRYLRYLSADGGYCNISDVQYYDQNGNLITGTPFGSSAAAGPGTDFTQAFDGNPATYVDLLDASGGFTGIDLGPNPTQVVTKIRYYPRPGYESRMVSHSYGQHSGAFQGSNFRPSNITVISEVDSSDGRKVVYNYQPFQDPTFPYAYQVLTSVSYPDGSQAQYTYAQIQPSTKPLITAFVDPRYVSGPLNKSRTDYFSNYSNIMGSVQNQRSYDTNEIICYLGMKNNNLHQPQLTYSNGAVETFNMNGGIMASEVDGLGKTTTYTYDAHGFIASQQDALGRIQTNVNTVNGHPLVVTFPDHSSQQWTRDAHDLPLTFTDELGHVTTWTRDGAHRITQVRYPDNTTENYSYNGFGQVAQHTLRNGASEFFTYNGRGLLQSKIDAANNQWSYTYDSLDRLAAVTDPLNHTTRFAYNDLGKITQTTFADGSTRSWTYDIFGNKLTETNELGNTSSFTYDQYQRLVRFTDPLNRTTQNSFVSNYYTSSPSQIILPSGKTTSFAYDLEWHLLSKTVATGTPDSGTISYVRDNVYRVITLTDAKGQSTNLTYDLRDRKTSATDALGRKTSWTYDIAGNLLTTTRPDNGVISNQYDVINRLISSTDPKGETTQNGYDSAGRLASVTDAKGDVSSYLYDSLNRKTAFVFPDNSQENWLYDAAGNVRQFITRAGQTKVSSYDARNRETGYTWSDSTPSVSRTYDVFGRLLTLNNGVSNVSYSYDSANQLLSETQAISGLNMAQVVGYSYDLDGNRLSMTEPDGTVTNYSFTNRNQVAGIAQGGSNSALYTYDANGNQVSRNLGNGTQTIYQRNQDDELTNLTMKNSNNSLLGSFGYTYDNVGRRTSVTHEDGKGEAYAYDAVDQLQTVAYGVTNPQSSASGASRTVGYQFDAVGNRTQVLDSQSGTTSYQTNVLNQYTQTTLTSNSGATSAQFWYDGNGNLTFGLANGAKYDYDAQNRIVTAAVNGQVIFFAYDARNRCVSRTVNGTTTYLIYNGWNLLEEWSGSGTELNRYLHGAGVDELIAKTNATSQTVFYHQDGLGSTASLTDVSGQVLEKYTYDVFGQVTITDATGQPRTASAYGNRFLFTGREFLSEVNLYDYRNRVYSADLGRFLQTDPLRFDAGDVNIYRYCGNNPINYLDSTGEKLKCDNLSPEQKQQLKDSLDKLSQNPENKNNIDSLRNSPNDINISVNDNKDDSFHPDTNTIHWDPEASMVTNNDNPSQNPNGKLDPTATLGHELDHANQYNTNPDQYNSDVNSETGNNYDNKEEQRVIQGSESSNAKQTGQGQRNNHRGTMFHGS